MRQVHNNIRNIYNARESVWIYALRPLCWRSRRLPTAQEHGALSSAPTQTAINGGTNVEGAMGYSG